MFQTERRKVMKGNIVVQVEIVQDVGRLNNLLCRIDSSDVIKVEYLRKSDIGDLFMVVYLAEIKKEIE